ncbi:uncharacterized protein LOC119336333 isoform X2 [Triticum dicoccoides]|uniref:uncharacterized protein LOC119336333 isoform X2 n=1 Tax=Triticum dicoccoides TaxID=85692 RepID=UPI00188FA4CE|nr:uncharacterized protein LOC119336333 isoform X2 [Triticum dicoccoides]
MANDDEVGRGGRLAGQSSRSRRQGRPWRDAHGPEQQEQLQPLVVPTRRLSPASSAAARTVETGSCTVADGEFSGRRLLSSSNPVPMGSPRLDCSSFFAGGVLVHCNSLRALDEHCLLRFDDLLGCCICNSVLLFKITLGLNWDLVSFGATAHVLVGLYAI